MSLRDGGSQTGFAHGDGPSLELHGMVQASAPTRAAQAAAAPSARVRVDGKFLRLADTKFWVKGVTYGPFEPQAENGAPLPLQPQLEADFRLIRGLQANTVRVYHVPDRAVLDTAHAFALKVLVDIPWSKHRRFLESRSEAADARRRVRDAARACREHPALLALSVANEIPSDVARWLGPDRVARFVDELVDVVHQEDAGALATFASFPPTEYLHPENVDFYTMNVYLHGRKELRAYLQRLQNQVDEKPLVLGEFGIDSLRQGEEEQAELLAMHLEEVYGCGLAGTCVFSFTDEWFTGGHAIRDWAFGLVRRDRSPKPAFHAVAKVFRSDPRPTLPRYPKVSVVVCSYNGSKTLDGCLKSLQKVDYPNYEVILVDDGSTDSVPEIAARYSYIRYHRQVNKGLSVARNVGMDLATGEIVAYTDDDCFADEDWLYFLVAKFLETDAVGVGGPNLLPIEDGPVSACVQASPGAPAHILIDDTVAEHIPGCNMAFRTDRLRAIGGFDAVYRKAGDDVDVCWRLQAEGGVIVYAPAAMVWHHRRSTVKAYLKQQRGYGEAEALLQRKHPDKFCGFRYDLSWMGRIYTRAGLGLEVGRPTIHHGVFGAGLFQTIYSPPQVWWPLVAMSLEWWLAACAMLGLASVLNPAAALARAGVLGVWADSPLANPLLAAPVLMLLATLCLAIRLSGQARPPAHQRRFWSRPVIAAMHVAQPVERGFARYQARFKSLALPLRLEALRRRWERRAPALLQRSRIDLWSESGVGREQILDGIVALAREHRWPARVDPGWASHDVRFYGTRFWKAELTSVTEEMGANKRLTGIRLRVKPTFFGNALLLGFAYLLLLGWGASTWALGAAAFGVAVGLGKLWSAAGDLRASVLAGVLTVAERLGTTTLGSGSRGDAEAGRREPEPKRREPLVPASAAAMVRAGSTQAG